MTKDTKLSELVINKLTTAQYNGIATKDPNQMYIVTDAHGFEESITNCLTYIPQDIKLELNNGILTLKAGSKVYVPNGKNADGSNRFDVVTVPNDTSWEKSTTAGTRIAFYSIGGSLPGIVSTYCYSGDTAKMNSTSAVTYGRFYNTETNKIYVGNSNGGSWVEAANSLPVGIFQNDASGNVASIDQIFNGFGHAGSTEFALPGVKGLIPNGRNEDGSLRNIEFTNDRVLIWTKIDNKTNEWLFESNNASTPMRGWGSTGVHFSVNTPVTTTYSWSYVVPENQWYYCNASGVLSKVYPLFFGKDTSTTTVISGFKPKTTFHALDYNDKSTIVGWGMPSDRYIDLTLGASGSEYTAQATGYVMFERGSTSGNKYISLYNNNSQLGVNGTTISGVANARIFLPVKRGDVFKASYSANTTNPTFRFIYAEGEK